MNNPLITNKYTCEFCGDTFSKLLPQHDLIICARNKIQYLRGLNHQAADHIEKQQEIITKLNKQNDELTEYNIRLEKQVELMGG